MPPFHIDLLLSLDSSCSAHPGHRRGRVSRLASLRAAGRRGARRHLPRQLLHQPEDERRAICSSRPNFELVRHDVMQPIWLEVDEIYNLACPAAPGHYQYNPIKTMKTSVIGRDQRAGHGQALPGQGAAGLDQRGLRRSRGPSAAGELSRLGQSDRPAGLLRRRQAGGRNAVHGLSPHEPREHPHRADLQYLRPADAPVRRPRGFELHSARRSRASRSRSSATASRPARSAIATIWSRA